MKVPVELDPAACRELLAAGLVSRVAVRTTEGPQVVPVNYAWVDGAAVFRTSPDSVVGQVADGGRVALEIDHIDYPAHRGLERARVGRRRVAHRRGSDRRRASGLEAPTLGRRGSGHSGERRPAQRPTIGAGWTRANEVPVRRRT